jgi:hypothetical protein
VNFHFKRLAALALAALTVSAILLAIVAGPANASAFPNRFGQRWLGYGQCCNNGLLLGSRASITPNNVNPGGSYCTAFRSDAEQESGPWLIQAGVVRCGGQANADGTCSLSNNLVKYVEIITPSSSGVCYPHGGTSTGTAVDARVSWEGVDNFGNEDWEASLDGTVEENLMGGMYGAQYILEGGEHAVGPNLDSCNTSDWGGTNKATFASSQAWQRQQPGFTWFTIQSASTSSGCWTVSGGPPNSFTIQFP